MAEDLRNEGIFDLPSADGVTPSERLLVRLCRKSFLSLWSYPNVHTDEGMRGGRGHATEFADVLVVFGDDVILFSDKHVKFHDDKPIGIAWKRWYKRAIAESSRQLHGALNWLRRFPERLFLDARCTRPLPVRLPPDDRARYHLVAITRGSFEACAKHHPGSLGTLKIDTSVEGIQHENSPFTIGLPDSTKVFVHIFDEFSLEAVLGELDTVTDFVQYLIARGQFLSDPHTKVVAAGEEQLLAAYLLNLNEERHSFTLPIEGKKPDLLVFDESHYSGLKARPEYLAKKQADAPSYFWDELIESFIQLGDPKIVLAINQDNHDTEQALRVIAAESRFRRRVLVESFRGFLVAAQGTPGKKRARIVTSKQDPTVVYIFLVVPKADEPTYEEYRKFRIAVLHAYCRCAKLKFPNATMFVGIGFDHPVKDYQGGSEDLVTYVCENLTVEERAEAEKFRKELGILGDGLTMQEAHDDEFPALGEFAQANVTINRERRRDSNDNEKKRKRKKKIANASRRRNQAP